MSARQDLGSAEPPEAADGDGYGNDTAPARQEIPFNSLGSTAQAVRLYGGEVNAPTPLLLFPSLSLRAHCSMFIRC